MPIGRFTKRCIDDDNGGIFKVTICDQDGVVRAMAHAQEDKGSSYINKTSFLENGFTSALAELLVI